MTEPTLWWVLSWGLIATGLAGAVLPLLPGTGLVLAGIVVGAWIDDFQRVGPWAIGIVVVLAIASWVLDYLAALLGARRVGASKLALVGAAVGMVLGILSGFLGVLFFPLAGAAIGEWIAHRDEQRAMRVGIATWIGLLLGLLAKVVIAFMMVGVFVVALLV